MSRRALRRPRNEMGGLAGAYSGPPARSFVIYGSLLERAESWWGGCLKFGLGLEAGRVN